MSKVTLEQVVAQFKNLNVPTTSKIRNESLQTKVTVPRINRIKKERKKKSKLLVLREVALDFDPLTGMETDTYNRDSKYRPALSATTMMLKLKELAEVNEATKLAILRKCGMDLTEWDTTDVDHLNKTDKEVFLKHLYPSIYTVNVCKVKLKSIANNNFGRDFKVDVTRDRMTGQVVGEEPLLLKLNRFLNMVSTEEYNKLAEENDKTGAKTADEMKEIRKKIRDRTVLVSSDRPANHIIAIELPLNERTEIPADFSLTGWERKDFLDHMVLIPVSGKLKIALDNYQNGTYYKADVHNDFLEIDMYCSNDEDKMELGKNTSYEKPSESVKERKDYDAFVESFIEFMDNDNNLEGIFQASSFISEVKPDTEAALCDAVAAFIPEDDERLTANVVSANAEVVNRMYSDELTAKLDLDLLEKGSSSKEEADEEENNLRAALQGSFDQLGEADSFDEDIL